MTRSQGEVVRIETASQLEALSSPVRSEMLVLMRARGSCTVEALASAMRMSRQTLHYHMRRLVKDGLAFETERRHNGQRFESLYMPAAKTFEIDTKGKPRDYLDMVRKTTGSRLRLAEKYCNEAMDKAPGQPGFLRISFRTARLSAKRIEQIRSLLDEAERLLMEEPDVENGEPVALLMMLTPRPEPARE